MEIYRQGGTQIYQVHRLGGICKVYKLPPGLYERPLIADRALKPSECLVIGLHL